MEDCPDATAKSEFNCRLCHQVFGRVFGRENALAMHMWSSHQEKTLKCKFCDKLFGKRKNLHIHLKTVHQREFARLPSPTFECKICAESFPRESNLAGHMWSAHQKKGFHCQICQKAFHRQINLYQHKRKVHTGKSGSKVIPISSANSSQDEKLDILLSQKQKSVNISSNNLEHNSTLTNVKSKGLSCRICAKDFARKWHLSNHMWRVHKQKGFACDICSQSYGRWANLKSHVSKAHSSSEKEILTCQICDKLFPQKSQLFNHKWRMHKEKSFECIVCKEKFSELKWLNAHKRKHDTTPLAISESEKSTSATEHDDFDCPICPDKFRNNEKLENHIWIDHLGESLTCSECVKTFRNKHFIICHVAKVHKRQTESSILETNQFLSKLVGLIEEIKVEVNTRPSMFDSSAFLSKIANIKNEETPNSKISKTPISKSIKKERKPDSDASELIDTSVFKEHDPDFSMDNKDPEELKVYFNNRLDKFLAAAPVLPGCQICSKKFTQNLSLFKHMRREHEVKCYACRICDRRFIARKNLNEHFGYVHLPKKWKCGKCALSFGRKACFDRHVKCQHSEEHCKEELSILG